MRIARSKTDQQGKGDTLAVPRVPDSPYCPVRAVLDWQVVADLTTGALLRRLHRGDRLGERLTAQSVALIIKQRAAQAGLEGAAAYPGHSRRRGFLTSAARNRATNPSTCCASTSKTSSASTITPAPDSCAAAENSRSRRQEVGSM